MCANFYVNKNKNQKRNYIKFVQYMNYMYNTHFRKLSLLQNIRDDKTAVLHQTGEQFNQIEDTWPSMVVAMRSILFCLLIISAAVMKISALFSKGVNSHCFLALRELSIAFWMISYYKQRHHTTGFQKQCSFAKITITMIHLVIHVNDCCILTPKNCRMVFHSKHQDKISLKSFIYNCTTLQ